MGYSWITICLIRQNIRQNKAQHAKRKVLAALKSKKKTIHDVDAAIYEQTRSDD